MRFYNFISPNITCFSSYLPVFTIWLVWNWSLDFDSFWGVRCMAHNLFQQVCWGRSIFTRTSQIRHWTAGQHCGKLFVGTCNLFLNFAINLVNNEDNASNTRRIPWVSGVQSGVTKSKRFIYFGDGTFMYLWAVSNLSSNNFFKPLNIK